MTGLRP